MVVKYGEHMNLNRAIQLLRKYGEVNQQTLAKALGLSPTYLCEIEKGKKKVSVEVLEKAAEFFKFSSSKIVRFAEVVGDQVTIENLRCYVDIF